LVAERIKGLRSGLVRITRREHQQPTLAIAPKKYESKSRLRLGLHEPQKNVTNPVPEACDYWYPIPALQPARKQDGSAARFKVFQDDLIVWGLTSAQICLAEAQEVQALFLIGSHQRRDWSKSLGQ
jgi:hypothetical protein